MRISSWLSRPWVRRGALLVVQITLAAILVVLLVPRMWSIFRLPNAPQARGTIAQQPPRRLNATAWEQLALPTPPADVLNVSVSSVNPALLFACTAHLAASQPGGNVTAQPVTLWRTTDAGAHWTRYAPTTGVGTGCNFSIAPDDPQRVTFQITQTAAPLCAQEQWYLSSDSGTTWRPLPPHTTVAPPASFGWCDLHVTRHHLYLAYSYERDAQAPQVGILERSDDDGIHWSRADQGLGENALFFMPAIGPGDTLMMPVVSNRGVSSSRKASTVLWASTDAGRTWRQQSTLPEYPGIIMFAPPARPGMPWPDPAHPFYALEHEQIPSNLYRERVLASGDGRVWSLLPALPVAGVSAERRGILQALAGLPDGRLAIWGTDPQVGLPQATQSQMERFWLWLWDPSAGQWQVVPTPLPAFASEGCGLCWGALTATDSRGATWLYVWHRELESAYALEMFRVLLA